MELARHSEYRLRRRVQFHEVDSVGIVHFSCYFRYMEEAEHALWREAGLSIAPRGRDIGFPRVATSFDFAQPLRFEEECDILIRIVALGRSSIRYTCTITRGGDRIAEGALTIACVRKDETGKMRAIAIPDDIRARLDVAPGAMASHAD